MAGSWSTSTADDAAAPGAPDGAPTVLPGDLSRLLALIDLAGAAHVLVVDAGGGAVLGEAGPRDGTAPDGADPDGTALAVITWARRVAQDAGGRGRALHDLVLTTTTTHHLARPVTASSGEAGPRAWVALAVDRERGNLALARRALAGVATPARRARGTDVAVAGDAAGAARPGFARGGWSPQRATGLPALAMMSLACAPSGASDAAPTPRAATPPPPAGAADPAPVDRRHRPLSVRLAREWRAAGVPGPDPASPGPDPASPDPEAPGPDLPRARPALDDRIPTAVVVPAPRPGSLFAPVVVVPPPPSPVPDDETTEVPAPMPAPVVLFAVPAELAGDLAPDTAADGHGDDEPAVAAVAVAEPAALTPAGLPRRATARPGPAATGASGHEITVRPEISVLRRVLAGLRRLS